MQILIKIVQGSGFMVDVDENTTVLELKKKIQLETQHSVDQQTLVLVGKTLLDEKPLSFYPNIKDGTKINLVIKKITKDTLNVALTKFLQKYYTETQSTKICDKFMKVCKLYSSQ